MNVEVLLAEDNASDAELTLLSLGGEATVGRIHLVHDGEEALEFLQCRGRYVARRAFKPVRLVLLDIKMPKVDGLTVLRELKADPRTRAIPVVLLTSSALEQDIAEGYRLGVNSYVQKPVEFVRFRETIQDVGRYWLSINEPPPAAVFLGEGP